MRKDKNSEKNTDFSPFSDPPENASFPFLQMKTPEFKKRDDRFEFSFGFFDDDEDGGKNLFPDDEKK